MRFSFYELRTTDVEAARAFYTEVVGLTFGGDSCLEVGPLPEQARARGAPAHWLGHIGVTDVDACAGRLGGERLGPTRHAGTDTIVTLRDPFGAVVAITSRAAQEGMSPVVWHDLNTDDAERALATYCGAFGWRGHGSFDLGGGLGAYRLFGWGDAPAGGMLSSVRLPVIHPHWLFSFGVADLDRCVADTRKRGGLVVGVKTMPDGTRVAPCEDPQGAAFALRSGQQV
jgi:predicted enzyme related to lactoylglutathione lyase